MDELMNALLEAGAEAVAEGVSEAAEVEVEIPEDALGLSGGADDTVLDDGDIVADDFNDDADDSDRAEFDLPRLPRVRLPQNHFAVFEITNPTDMTLRYAIQWGDEENWQDFSLATGMTMAHSWRYAFVNQNRYPNVYIRFGFRPYGGETTWQVYKLAAYTSPHSGSGHGKQYQFLFNADETDLELQHLN